MFRMGSCKRDARPLNISLLEMDREETRMLHSTNENGTNTRFAPFDRNTRAPPKKIGKSEEKGLSPSKNYQVLTTSLGKNLPPSLLPKDEER